MNFKKAIKKFGSVLNDNSLNLLILSILTGVFTGVILTFYNILISYGEDFSTSVYTAVFEHPAFVPLLFLALAAGAILIGTLVKFVPMIRGSGIPQIEGAARGKIAFNWYKTLCAMFAASLACVCLGLSAGAEGPSLEMGGCVGEAVGKTFKRSQMTRRLQIASGSSAGLAVAFNAPVTGMIFALEEAFRSFSAQVFICSAVSVACALVVRNLIRTALGLTVTFAFEGFTFNAFSVGELGYVLLAVIVCALLGVAMYYGVMGTKKFFSKITFFKGVGKFLIPFLAAGCIGLVSVYAMGGGHSFIDALATGGTGEYSITCIFGLGVLATIIIVTLLRFIAIIINMGSGVPCGSFIPMLAVGAGAGAIMAMLCNKMGMDPALNDYLAVICMAAFFTAIVKAPITGIIMCFELTGQFTNFLPVLIGVAVGYLIGELCRTQPIYEKCLDMFIEEEGYAKNAVKERVRATIMPKSPVDGNRVRKVVWPANGLVVKLIRADGSVEVPDGETILSAGEIIIFECETSDFNELKDYMSDITGDENVEKEPIN